MQATVVDFLRGAEPGARRRRLLLRLLEDECLSVRDRAMMPSGARAWIGRVG